MRGEMLELLRSLDLQPTLEQVDQGTSLDFAQYSLLRESAEGQLPRDAEALAARIKAIPVRFDAVAGIERAISSAGGVPFEALDAQLMIRALPGVFAAGEMIDWEAPTGGYLLQAAFSTGAAAASGILDYLHVASPIG